MEIAVLGARDGTFLLLSKGPPDLSPENFRLTPQFSEPRLQVPFQKHKKITSIQMDTGIFGARDGT